MTQTERYKLNLLDWGDRISPEPLNENMEKVEAEFKNAAAALSSAVGSGGYNARIAFGSYVGGGANGSSHTNSIEVPFKPMFVQVMPGAGPSTPEGVSVPSAFVRPAATALGDIDSGASSHSLRLTWGANSVSWTGGHSSSVQLNLAGRTYYWVALGYTEQESAGNGEA